MPHFNFEIKSRCDSIERVRRRLLELGAEFRGMDHQTDTYFHIPDGRLKLRSGNIENNLIYYDRANQAGPKSSTVSLYPVGDQSEALCSILEKVLGIWKIVRKKREIYFIDNVKFHLDEVYRLGEFVEIEAIDYDGTLDLSHIEQQCRHYIKELKLTEDQFITGSYSDMIE